MREICRVEVKMQMQMEVDMGDTLLGILQMVVIILTGNRDSDKELAEAEAEVYPQIQSRLMEAAQIVGIQIIGSKIALLKVVAKRVNILLARYVASMAIPTGNVQRRVTTRSR